MKLVAKFGDQAIRSNIVEGYGRRIYKGDYIRFIIYALSSCDETIDHLDTLYETESLKDKEMYMEIRKQTEILGKMINKFLQSVQKNHNQFN